MGEAEKLLRQKMELLSMKNITVEAQMKNLADAIKIGEEESARKSKAIAEKIREHDSLSLGLQQKINYEVNLAKLALQQEYQEKEAKFL